MENTEVVEVKKQKKTLKEWWNENKVVKYVKDHPETALTVLGGALTLVGELVRLAVSKSEYQDNVFTACEDTGEIYKIPAKHMKTVRRTTEKPEK